MVQWKAVLALVLAAMPMAAIAQTQTFRDCSTCPEMVVIPQSGPGGPRLAFGKYEVTVGEYWACVDAHACRARGLLAPRDQQRLPVTGMTEEDAEGYARWLSTITGLSYRLPTPDEWRFAARGGRPPRTWSRGAADICAVANVNDLALLEYLGGGLRTDHVAAQCNDGFARHAPVGSYPPNGYGLFDMVGNVSELACIQVCAPRIYRMGGSYQDYPHLVGSETAAPDEPNARFGLPGFGMRVVREM